MPESRRLPAPAVTVGSPITADLQVIHDRDIDEIVDEGEIIATSIVLVPGVEVANAAKLVAGQAYYLAVSSPIALLPFAIP